ncbi:MAG: ketopantoate reductase family protein [Eubacteriales bacterium]
MFQTISIIGLGALGILFGKPLLDNLPAGDLRIIADHHRTQRYTANPPTINGAPCPFSYIVPGADVPPADLVIVAVKSTGLEQAMVDMASQVDEHTVIISLLNGISSEELLETRWPGQVLYSVSLAMDAQRVGQDVVYTKAGFLQFGEKNGEISHRVTALANFFTENNFPHQVCQDIRFHQWNKWMLNVGCNQVCAVFRVPYRDLGLETKAKSTMLSAMDEVVAIAAACGVQLTQAHIAKWQEILASLSPDGLPSMAQDVVAHRKTEVGIFGGTACALGKKHNIPTPTNDFLVAEIAKIEATFSMQ